MLRSHLRADAPCSRDVIVYNPALDPHAVYFGLFRFVASQICRWHPLMQTPSHPVLPRPGGPPRAASIPSGWFRVESKTNPGEFYYWDDNNCVSHWALPERRPVTPRLPTGWLEREISTVKSGHHVEHHRVRPTQPATSPAPQAQAVAALATSNLTLEQQVKLAERLRAAKDEDVMSAKRRQRDRQRGREDLPPGRPGSVPTGIPTARKPFERKPDYLSTNLYRRLGVAQVRELLSGLTHSQMAAVAE